MLAINLRRLIIENQKFIEYLRRIRGITINVNGSLIKVKLNRKLRRIVKLNVNGGIIIRRGS
jgi:hypothetical protein